jgi:hypothetical protein
MTVQALRRWIDEPRPMGLPKECSNLIILIFAAQTNRSFRRHGAPFDASLTNLPEEVELRVVDLPSETTWVTAVERASRIFGSVSSPLLNASNLAKLADDLQARAKENIESCRRLVDDLATHLADFGQPKDGVPRYKTADAVLDLLEAVGNAKPAAVIEALASLKPTTSEAAMGSSFASAPGVVAAMASTQWKLFDSIRALGDDRAEAARLLLGRVCEALRNDQHVTTLRPVLEIEQSRAIDLLAPPATPPRPTVSPPVQPPTKPGKKVVDNGARQNVSLAEAETEIGRLKQKIKTGQTVRVNVSWVIEE